MIPRLLHCTAAALLAFGLSACHAPEADQLPPFGEVLISIDTDAPVPDLLGRLRIDVFDADGQWLDSRDVARNDPKDWPASFSVHTEDPETRRQVLVRARGYLEGRVRDYRGERFQARTLYAEPHVADTLEELCAKAPALVLGQPLTLRRGSRTLTSFVPDEVPPNAPLGYQPACDGQVVGGAVAATLNVETAGEYRIETTGVEPNTADPVLFIRRDCREAATQIGCNDDFHDPDLLSADYRSRLVMRLEPGSYTVISASYTPSPSDVTLRADLASHWQTPSPSEKERPVPGTLPRLLVNGADETPSQEPEPFVTIDRLALIRIVPGEKRYASLLLRTACAGQMAKLSATGSNAAPVLAEAQTCLDAEGELRAVSELATTKEASATSSGSITGVPPGAACPADSAGQAACIPGGPFVFGSPLYAPYPFSTAPERFALMTRYWLDRTEVTVGRYRAALARGFLAPYLTPIANDAPLDPEYPGKLYFRHCTFSQSPAPGNEDRESYPVNCVDWFTARAFCQFEGGDLPSEAQWQYAASKAGRADEIDDACAVAQGDAASTCGAPLTNPAAVDDARLASDVTPLGVHGLFGNVSEQGLDSFQALDSGCWLDATVVDPICWERDAPLRTLLGADFSTRTQVWRRDTPPSGAIRTQDYSAMLGDLAIGFRCAYREAPR